MSLQIILQLNHLTKDDPDDYMAAVYNVQYKTQADIIKQITRSGSILKDTECMAVINAFWKAIAENIEEGVGFSNEYISVTPSAGGVFESIDEPFDEKKHWKKVRISASKKLNESCARMKVERINRAGNEPFIIDFVDIFTQSKNTVITPGFMADIHGENLKVLGEEAGVFFINTETGNEIVAPKIHLNQPQKLTVILPNLEAGLYQLQIRTHLRKSKVLITGIFNTELRVG